MAGGVLAGRVALVTGASRGLGAATAMELARQGAHVLLLARNEGALADIDDAIKAEGGLSTLIALDLASADDIDAMAYALFERFSRLDILVGAAAVLGGLSPVAHYAVADWNRVMAVNVTANWRLARSFDALLRRSDAGRAVFVTCSQARDLPPYWSAYGSSKAALEAMALTWSAETAAISPLAVNLVDPGPMKTRLHAEAFPGIDPATLPGPEAAARLIADLASPACPHRGRVLRPGTV